MSNPTAPLAIANEIANQIGHRAFLMMGTKHKLGDENSLSFDIHGCREFSKIRITLELSDTYKVEFFKFRKWETIRHEVIAGIYADGLRQVIETKTGLYLSL